MVERAKGTDHVRRCQLLARSVPPEMSAICPLSGAKRTSASDCLTIAIYDGVDAPPTASTVPK